MAAKLTTAEAAAVLKVGARRVRELITSGKLPAEKAGRDYLIRLTDIKRLKRKPAGRPRAK